MSALHTPRAFAPSGRGMPWFVDAWSVGDGSLFASQRPTRVDIWREDADDEVDTVVLRAPDFEPVQVSRALAFGAMRRGAQEGFSLDGQQEQAFGSLAELRELARRAYMASALGDSGPEGDGVPPPGGPPPRDGPSFDGYGLTDPRIREGLADVLGVLAIHGEGQSLVRGKLADAVHEAMDEHLVNEAARLMVLGADLTARQPAHGAIGLAASLLQVAAGLAGPFVIEALARQDSLSVDTRLLTEWLSVPVRLQERVVIGHGVVPGDAWHLLGDALLPAFPVRDALGLPPRCQTWIDALEYLGSDRLHYQRCRRGEWLPLAVAAGAVATSARAAVLPWLDVAGAGTFPHRQAWRRVIAQFVSQLVPAAGLAPDVEDWLRDRCWSYQRRGPAGRMA